jgi:hypothetical protein
VFREAVMDTRVHYPTDNDFIFRSHILEDAPELPYEDLVFDTKMFIGVMRRYFKKCAEEEVEFAHEALFPVPGESYDDIEKRVHLWCKYHNRHSLIKKMFM